MKDCTNSSNFKLFNSYLKIFIYCFFGILLCVSCGDDDPSSAHPEVIGLTDETNPQRSHTWNWTCNKVCTYRHVINQSRTYSFPSTASYNTITTATQDTGEGEYWLHVQAKDSVFRTSSVVSVSVFLDNTPPVPSTFSLPTSSNDTTPGLTVEGLVSGDKVTLYKSLNVDEGCLGRPTGLGTVSAGRTSLTVVSAPLPRQSRVYYYSFEVRDIAGNTSPCISDPDRLTYVLDLDPPQVTNLKNDRQPKGAKTWVWGCNESECVYRHFISQESSYHFADTATYNSQTTVDQSTGHGTFYLYVQARDLAGNESEVKKVSVILNETPGILGLADDPYVQTSKTWTWSCNRSKCQYRYVINQRPPPYRFSTSQSYKDTTMATQNTGSGKYYLHIQAKDAYTNEESIVLSFSAILR